MNDAERIVALQVKVAELERKLNFVLNHLNLPYTDNALSQTQSQVTQYLRQGNKLEAIKAYREATGAGLKEAKDAVEAMERNLGIY